MIDVLLQALQADPADETAWLALADELEETGQIDRAELTRFTRRLRTLSDDGGRSEAERRVQELLQSGVQPCVPLLTNSIGMVFALIPPGTFRMGSPSSEDERLDDEGPVHEVEITRPFYLGAHQVTQEQYERVMGVNSSRFTSIVGVDTRRFPVENVSWKDASKFCRKLSEAPEEKMSERRYRLPSEAEWEYACRAGGASSRAFSFGASLSSSQANFNGKRPYAAAKGPYLRRTCQVGSYKPSSFALYDMHGNVWEWCADWYDPDYYRQSPRKDPPGASEGSGRVVRGGSWGGFGRTCRSAYRGWHLPWWRDNHVGFRVALVASGQ